MATYSAKGRTEDGAEFDGTTEGFDRVAPGRMTDARYILTSVVFHTAGTISDLEVILWDGANNERAGLLLGGGGSSAAEQTYATAIELPVDENGNSYEVRVISSTQSVALAKISIDGHVEGRP